MHGDDDATVPIRGSSKFVEVAKDRLPESSVRFDVVAGGDHAFDLLGDPWSDFRPQALEFTSKAWLRGLSK